MVFKLFSTQACTISYVALHGIQTCDLRGASKMALTTEPQRRQYNHTPQARAAQLSCYSTPLLDLELGFHNYPTFVAYPPSVTCGADGTLCPLASCEFSLPNSAPS